MARRMKHFTDLLIEDYAHELVDQWVKLNIEPWRYNYLAQNWKCPNSKENRAILPEEQWKKEKEAFLACGKDVEVFDEAEICGTYYGPYGKTYLVWLEFWGQDGEMHTIDVWINENGKNVQNAEKFIDPRSPLCKDAYESIVSNGSIPAEIAELLPTIGSKTWTSSTENKVQKKLNSWKQQSIFEDVVNNSGLNIKLIKLDKFDDYLYRGDPGKLADYDLILTTKDGIEFKARIDLKLLEDNETSKDQNPHDAELLITSEWRTGAVSSYRFSGEPGIEDTEEFKTLLSLFNQALLAAGKCFLHINNIDLKTGKVDFALFGNNG